MRQRGTSNRNMMVRARISSGWWWWWWELVHAVLLYRSLSLTLSFPLPPLFPFLSLSLSLSLSSPLVLFLQDPEVLDRLDPRGNNLAQFPHQRPLRSVLREQRHSFRPRLVDVPGTGWEHTVRTLR